MDVNVYVLVATFILISHASSHIQGSREEHWTAIIGVWILLRPSHVLCLQAYFLSFVFTDSWPIPIYPFIMHRSRLSDDELSHRNTIAIICSLNAIQIFSESFGMPLPAYWKLCSGLEPANAARSCKTPWVPVFAADTRIKDAKSFITSSLITWSFISIRHWGTLVAQSG